MKKRIFRVVSLVLGLMACGVYAQRACARLAETFSPTRAVHSSIAAPPAPAGHMAVIHARRIRKRRAMPAIAPLMRHSLNTEPPANVLLRQARLLLQSGREPDPLIHPPA